MAFFRAYARKDGRARMGMRKGKFTEKVCMDCGKTVLMYSSAKRCPKCRAKHEKEYHKDYDANWRKPITAEDRKRYAENRKRKALERAAISDTIG